jgi:hypothetical protein
MIPLFRYTAQDGCCLRRCGPLRRCDVSEHGCVENTDCQDGLKCESDVCVDIDECSENPDLCSAKELCRNKVGTYVCTNICTEEYPCQQAQGHCSDDSQCQLPTFNKCYVGGCVNTALIPFAQYPNNIER